MKIPNKDTVKRILTEDVPNFQESDKVNQNLAIAAYRMGYYDACNKAAEIVEADAAQFADKFQQTTDYMDEICGGLKP